MDVANYFALGFVAGVAMILLVAWVCAALDENHDGPIDL